MLFSSIPFLFYFLPCVLLLYALSPGRMKNFTLLVCSLVFYAWGEPRLVFLMMITVLGGYLLGLATEKFPRYKKLFLVLSLIIGPKLIRKLQILHFGQVVRNDGPESHFSKRGTPTMGGIMIVGVIIITCLLWCRLDNIHVWIVLFTLFAYSSIGFADDYLKVIRKNSDGLIPRWKYFWQSLCAIIVGATNYSKHCTNGNNQKSKSFHNLLRI